MKTISQERLKELVNYDPDTGVFTWRFSRRGNARAGNVIGNKTFHGYLQGGVDGQMWRMHRLAFLYMTGTIPEMIDHINLDKTDNRWENLRVTSNVENSFNKGTRRDSCTGMKGVRFRPKKNLYQAYVRHLGKYRHLGNFKTAEEAFELASLARDMIHGEFARHG